MRRAVATAALAGLLMFQGQAARAQLLDQLINPNVSGVRVEPGVTVLSRLRPDYDYGGIRVGSVLVRSEYSEAAGYDDNVTGTSKGQGSSFVQSRLNLSAATDLSRYGAAVRLTVNDNRYLDQPKQSATDWTASAGGFYELGRDTVSLDYSHANLVQTPRDLDTPRLDKTIAYRVDTVQAGYRITFNRLSLRPVLALQLYDFDDGTIAGQPYPQRFRNRVVAAPAVTASYEFSPGRTAVLVVRGLDASYTNRPIGSTVRDFNDESVLAGLDFASGGPWRFRLLAGYEVRNFVSSRVKTIQAPIVEGTVIYTPTGLTTLTGAVGRRIQDSADETTLGYTETSARFSVDHEYYRNVLLRAQGGFFLDEYNGGGNQSLLSGGAGATWLVNRTVRLSATYDFTTRLSSGGGVVSLTPTLRSSTGYSDNRYLLQLGISL
ncbi:MAG TPA: outer membrane beta-barrel protein [Acetobacteraceae bacterium]